MDPDENLAEQIKLALRIQAAADAGRDADPDVYDDGARLAELVIALNDWIGNGGFPPRKWSHPTGSADDDTGR